ncbi:MAG: hypothetical protein PHW11_06335 [Anaerolineaceae bacterium]|nr:hypothetical protein [Anaerolineaceae bacterium]MDD4042450.1 hypothetical protein [Anaerolineaceae bacterium]
MAREVKRNFGSLLETTTEAFESSQSVEEQGIPSGPKMINNRQSVYRVPVSMIRPDRFQARLLLPLPLRAHFYSGERDWRETVQAWFALAKTDRLNRRMLDELIVLGDSLHDTGQIKPVTGQIVNEDGRDVFKMLTGERRFWATAIQAVLSESPDEPYVLALIDNQPSLEKQIAENMAYKALTPVGKARAAARLVLEANQIQPAEGEKEVDYFRRVNDVRLNDEVKDLLQKNLQMERTYFGRLMNFFQLPETSLELADRAEMPERVLREIMRYDARLWSGAVEYFAEFDNRSYLDVQAFLERESGKTQTRQPRIPADPLTKSARSLKKVLLGMDQLPQEDKSGSLADALIGDSDKKEAQELADKITALAQAVQTRVKALK